MASVYSSGKSDAELAQAWLQPIRDAGGNEPPGTLRLVATSDGADVDDDNDDEVSDEWCEALDIISSDSERALQLMIEILRQCEFEYDFESVSPWLAEFFLEHRHTHSALIRSSITAEPRLRGWVCEWILEELQSLPDLPVNKSDVAALIDGRHSPALANSLAARLRPSPVRETLAELIEWMSLPLR